MNAVIDEINKPDYYVADIGQADFGRREIAIAETERPGLMSIREEFSAEQPPQGARIAGSLKTSTSTGSLPTVFLTGVMVKAMRISPT